MTYCPNPDCKQPQNPDSTEVCLQCQSKLLFKNQYRAIQLMGAGAFGRTFLAEDLNQGNAHCIIKQFSPLPQIQAKAEAMAKATQVFEQEAKQQLELREQYPHIPTLFDYFEQDKHLYLVRPYIEGQNLSQELQEQGAFNEHQVREFLYDVLPVLQLLHKRQIIHRAIKPTNIIRNSDRASRTLRERKFVLIDCGISKHLTDTRLTKTVSRLDTEAYTPIEQMRGGKAYPASDLYSVGVICIQMLTGAQPDELYDPLEGQWIWRESINNAGTEVSDSLGQILDKLLKDSVRERYQSASEVLKDFYTGASRGGTATTGQPRPVSAAPLPEQKTPGWRCLHTVAGHTDTVTAVAFSPDGKMLASGSADHTIKIWQSDTGRLIRTIRGHTDAVACVTFSPATRMLASSSADNTVKIWQSDSGTPIHTLTGHSVTVFSVAFSPDGKILASGSGDGTIKLWHPGSGKLLNVLTGHADFVESVTFSPNGDRIASGSWDNTIKIWHVATGKLLHTLKGHSASVWSVVFSPDSQTLLSSSGDNTIKIWHLETGTLLRTLTENADSAWSLALSPDGQTLASDSGNSTIKIWHLGSGKLLRTLSGHLAQIRAVAFSRDGKTLASGSDDKTFKIWRYD